MKNKLIVRLGDDKVLTHVGDSSQYPEVGMVAANHGFNKLLKEVGAGFGIDVALC